MRSCERILYEYGEERYAPAIAKQPSVRAAWKSPSRPRWSWWIIIRAAMPAAALREKQHPAKRSFQAIRIAVNDELGELAADAPRRRAESRSRAGGWRSSPSIRWRTASSSASLQALATGCTCPPEFPVCVCGKKPKMKLITRKPIVSGEEELDENPRARSAKLRVAEKC